MDPSLLKWLKRRRNFQLYGNNHITGIKLLEKTCFRHDICFKDRTLDELQLLIIFEKNMTYFKTLKTFDMWMCEDNNHAAMKTIWRIKQKT